MAFSWILTNKRNAVDTASELLQAAQDNDNSFSSDCVSQQNYFLARWKIAVGFKRKNEKHSKVSVIEVVWISMAL